MLVLYLSFIAAYRMAGGHFVPKMHAGVHQFREQAVFFGNPKCTATWEDESENGLVAGMAKLAHPMTFSLNCFQRIIAGERNYDSSDSLMRHV